jgi:hypothetical protein
MTCYLIAYTSLPYIWLQQTTRQAVASQQPDNNKKHALTASERIMHADYYAHILPQPCPPHQEPASEQRAYLLLFLIACLYDRLLLRCNDILLCLIKLINNKKHCWFICITGRRSQP